MRDCSWGTTRHPHPAPTPRTRARSGESSASLLPGLPALPVRGHCLSPRPRHRGGAGERDGSRRPVLGAVYTRTQGTGGMRQCRGQGRAPGPRVGLHAWVCLHPHTHTTHTHPPHAYNICIHNIHTHAPRAYIITYTHTPHTLIASHTQHTHTPRAYSICIHNTPHIY